jgi:hypothetical protein
MTNRMMHKALGTVVWGIACIFFASWLYPPNSDWFDQILLSSLELAIFVPVVSSIWVRTKNFSVFFCVSFVGLLLSLFGGRPSPFTAEAQPIAGSAGALCSIPRITPGYWRVWRRHRSRGNRVSPYTRSHQKRRSISE